jgi:hypothetical protein
MRLVGDGFWIAFLQAATFYYVAGLLIHCIIPRLAPVQGIQKQVRKDHEAWRDAFFSIGTWHLPAHVLLVWTSAIWCAHSTSTKAALRLQPDGGNLSSVELKACMNESFGRGMLNIEMHS